MSNLLVQTIKHTNNTTAQTIDTSGRTTAVLNNDTTYRSDGGAVTQNMAQGLCKVWAEYGGTSDGNSTITLNDSFNVGSLTDNGTGDYTFAYTNNMASIDYVFVGGGQYETGAVGSFISVNAKSGDANNRGASSVRVHTNYLGPTASSIAVYDYAQQQFLVQGDMA
jgi:hypothetical protein